MTRRRSLMVIMAVMIVVLLIVGTAAWFLSSPLSSPEAQADEISSVPVSVETGPAKSANSSGQTLVITPRGVGRDLIVLTYKHFTVGYDPLRRSPGWVSYRLDGPITVHGPSSKRPSRFRGEPRVEGEATHDDYTKSGFDRGHLCPNYAIFSRYGATGALETFVMTNVIPQKHGVNAGLWELLEELVAGRDTHGDGWAGRRRNLTIINGPIYRGADEYLPSGVPIPDAMFSVVLDYQEETGMYEALAWEIPNRDTVVGPLSRYLVSISAIEQEAGLEIDSAIELLEVTPVSVWPTR